MEALVYALPYLLLIRLHRAAIDARRKDRTWRYLAWSVVAGALAALLIAIGAAATIVLWMIGWWPLALAVLVVATLPALGPVIVRHVLVPLGWVRQIGRA
jgi:hypothetical protein